MFDVTTLSFFVTASLVLLVVPGPAVLYITARSVDQGRWAGMVSVFGVHLGTIVHVLAAALGVSAILMTSALAFSLVRYAGAAYLIYLGIKRILKKSELEAAGLQPQSHARVFWEGFVVNILNPKTALFFLAFLPQFVDPSRGAVGLQVAVLGALFIALGIVTDGVYALLAGSAARWLRAKPRVLGAQKYLTGGIFIALGVGAALSGSGRKG
jgi:threonine/homoserine/homoserine lactone efflux protein